MADAILASDVQLIATKVVAVYVEGGFRFTTSAGISMVKNATGVIQVVVIPQTSSHIYVPLDSCIAFEVSP